MARELHPFIKQHKHALIFAGGVATAIIGAQILKSKAFKDTATNAMAGVISTRKDFEETFQDMKENAEDIVYDANAETKQEIYIERKE